MSACQVLPGEKRPIPHTEPSGSRDNPEDGIRIYFIDSPAMEPSRKDISYFFENEDGQLEIVPFGHFR
jgi:hypothetical protein